MKGEEERRTGFLFSHSPSSILRLFLLSLSNFRLIVRLEQLAAPVHVISEVTNFDRHNPDTSLCCQKENTQKLRIESFQ